MVVDPHNLRLSLKVRTHRSLFAAILGILNYTPCGSWVPLLRKCFPQAHMPKLHRTLFPFDFHLGSSCCVLVYLLTFALLPPAFSSSSALSILSTLSSSSSHPSQQSHDAPDPRASFGTCAWFRARNPSTSDLFRSGKLGILITPVIIHFCLDFLASIPFLPAAVPGSLVILCLAVFLPCNCGIPTYRLLRPHAVLVPHLSSHHLALSFWAL